MIFKPTIPADLEPMVEPHELYSDYHKEAFGCRPRLPEPSDPTKRAIEAFTIDAFIAEGARMDLLRLKVARFDVGRGIEYRMRREGLDRLEAFKRTVQDFATRPYPNDHRPSWDEVMNFANDPAYGWEWTAMDMGMPQQLGPDLKALWEELNG